MVIVTERCHIFKEVATGIDITPNDGLLNDIGNIIHIINSHIAFILRSEHVQLLDGTDGDTVAAHNFSNVLFNGNNYYLIDFLDSFVETPLQDIVKIRQDTCYRWSQLMYTKRYDVVRLRIVCNKIDREIDGYFSQKYAWYRQYYKPMQQMNILRILPYAHERKVVDYLVTILKGILDEI